MNQARHPAPEQIAAALRLGWRWVESIDDRGQQCRSLHPCEGAAGAINVGRSFLVCCEHSGVVREAFRSRGIDAWSCDLLPSDDDSPHHIKGDCRDSMRSRDWTGFGFHPDCTFLTVAGIHWNNRGRGWGRTMAALEFVRELISMAGDKPYYLENPVSIISTHVRKPDQTVQPYDFGEDASKRTCLWLNKLPPLKPTLRIAGRIVADPRSGKSVERWSNQTDSGQNKLAPSENRWKLRSKTYAGIASAMANQWWPFLASADLPTWQTHPLPEVNETI